MKSGSLVLLVAIAASAPAIAAAGSEAGGAEAAGLAVERVVAILANGEAALADGRTKALRAALVSLDAIGATPIGVDAARRWRARLGARAPAPRRGRGLGPGYRVGTLDPGEVIRIEQIFLGGESAEIAVQTLERGVLRLEIAGDDGRTTCAPPTSTRSRCKWIPVFTQRFAIRLTNMARSPTPYYLAIN